MASLGEWVEFFVKAGIPSGEAASYALIFAKNRIQKNMLIDLNKEYLRDMGITPLGDIIAILKHSRTVHETASRAFIMSEASEMPEHAPSSTVNRLMDHFSLKLKEAKEEITAKKEKPECQNTASIHDIEPRVNATKSSVKLSASSISVSDTDEESDEPEPRVFHPDIVTKPDPVPVQLKSQPQKTRDRVNTGSPVSQSTVQKLCVFSRLGNAGSKNVTETITIKKETAHVQPSEKRSGKKISSIERPAASALKTLPSSELKMIKITTEFSDDDDIEINLPEQAIAAKVASANTTRKAPRKRPHADESQDTDPGTSSLSAGKKVRFGGTSTRVIPANTPLKSPVFLGHTVVVKTPTPTVERVEARKTVACKPRERTETKVNVKIERVRPELLQIAQIKSRIGVVRPTPAKPISKMVADTIMPKGDQKSVKSRIDLKSKGGKGSVRERLGWN